MLQNALYFYSLLVPSKQNTTFSLFSDVFLRCQNLDIMNVNVLIVCARIFFLSKTYFQLTKKFIVNLSKGIIYKMKHLSF